METEIGSPSDEVALKGTETEKDREVFRLLSEFKTLLEADPQFKAAVEELQRSHPGLVDDDFWMLVNKLCRNVKGRRIFFNHNGDEYGLEYFHDGEEEQHFGIGIKTVPMLIDRIISFVNKVKIYPRTDRWDPDDWRKAMHLTARHSNHPDIQRYGGLSSHVWYGEIKDGGWSGVEYWTRDPRVKQKGIEQFKEEIRSAIDKETGRTS